MIREIRSPWDWQPVNSCSHLPNVYGDIAFSRWDIPTKVCELVYQFSEVCDLKRRWQLCFICVLAETNASRCLLQVMQQGFCLVRCICKKHWIICIVCICHNFCKISSASFLMWNHFLLLDLLMFIVRNLGRF